MRKMLSDFLKTYWRCLLLGTITITGWIISYRYAELYKTGDSYDMIRFDLKDLYQIFVVPVCSLLYGCISYITTKKAWIPQLILFITFFVGGSAIDIIFAGKLNAWVGIIILSTVPVFFSIISTLLTALIYKIIKAVRI